MQRQIQKQKEEQKVADAPVPQKQKINVFVGQLGAESIQLNLPVGTKLSEVVAQCKLERMEIRVNRQNVPMGTELKEGDLVVAVPDAINYIVAVAA